MRKITRLRPKCVTPFCRNDRETRRRKCSKCRSREKKEKNPLRYYFNILRCHANERGIPFELKYVEYVELCEEFGFTLDRRGKSHSSLSFDRIHSKLQDGTPGPYAKWNLRVCTISENAAKNDSADWLSKFAPYFKLSEADQTPEETQMVADIPF